MPEESDKVNPNLKGPGCYRPGAIQGHPEEIKGAFPDSLSKCKHNRYNLANFQ